MVKAGGARMIRQEAFEPKELAKQIQAMAMKPASLANAAHCAFNCGRPDAAKDLADLVESMSGIDLMDVIRVGEAAPHAAQAATRTQTATRKAARERAEP
jgi:UDP-N-acetylglucosamine--N-acetylmuramyl-(pentapeptide) pyrophosphoryl-undecaprenol N-acetylglucosamine transferase